MVGKLSVLLRALTRPDSNPGAQLFYIQSPISQVFTQGVYVAKKLYLWVNKHADHISDVCFGFGGHLFFGSVAQLFYIQLPISQVFTQGVYVAKKLYLWVNKHADHISDVCLGVGDSSKKIFDWNLIESL